jgi:GxxExxY protein
MMNINNYKYSDLTEKIIKAFYSVYNNLGYGFLEKVYENALKIELENQGLTVENQKPIKVYYYNDIIGEYYADLLVDQKVILELKAAKSISEEHECQLVNYLKATNIEVGLLLNFGTKPEFRRKVFSSEFKKLITS